MVLLLKSDQLTITWFQIFHISGYFWKSQYFINDIKCSEPYICGVGDQLGNEQFDVVMTGQTGHLSVQVGHPIWHCTGYTSL